MMRALKVLAPVLMLIAGLTVAALLIIYKRGVTGQPVQPLPPMVRVVEVQPQDVTFTVHAQGNVRPRTEISLVAQVSGKVVAVAPSFEEGGFFEQGEVLVTIEKRDYELAVTQAQAALAQAQVALQREEAEAAVAREEWDKLGRGKPNPLLLREPQLAQARAQVASAEAQLERARLDLERCDIRAPFAGRVRVKNVDVGQVINRGEVLARIYAVDYAEVEVPLPLKELAYLDLPLEYRGEGRSRMHPRATVRARFAGRTYQWQGYVERTEGEIDTRTRMLRAVVRVEDPYARGMEQSRPPLAVGLFVDVEIQGRTATNVLAVPRSAMRGEDRLMVVDAQNKLRLKPVRVVRAEREQVVLAEPLAPGERVCLSPLDVVVSGMKVRVQEQPAEEAAGMQTARATTASGSAPAALVAEGQP